ncbi:MAG: LD-carboxypeptidase [Bacilli bacterium]|jgi:muramoyltetrapeptide carboxypeptidase|nr:LD-carboxypeptidase [Bacilli bacterium]MDD4056139.1 LD-carboxypeptidase [Bacilli bacterium]
MKYKPNKLKPNDKIGLVCPAFKNPDLSSTKRAVEYLKSKGYQIKVGETCYASEGYLAGSDQLRAKDLEKMFLDDEVKAIICMRGGYGASRMVDLIDYDIIKAHPKLFVGYSDITVLLNAIYHKAKVPTIHGMVGFAFGTEKFVGASEDDFWELMTKDQKNRILKDPFNNVKTLIGGSCCGELVGGNLSLLATMIASDYGADFTDKILFIEEVEEEPYKLDRYFSVLRLSGKLEKVKGFIFGYFTECEPTEKRKGTQTYIDLIKEYFAHYQKPMIYDFPSGHSYPFINLPIGIEVRLDADEKSITILEELYQK